MLSNLNERACSCSKTVGLKDFAGYVTVELPTVASVRLKSRPTLAMDPELMPR